MAQFSELGFWGPSDCYCFLKGKRAGEEMWYSYTLFNKLCSAFFIAVLLFFKGLLCDLLWSDPDKDVQGWGENDRGVSFTFGADVVSKFLNRHDLDLICRAHQVWNIKLLDILIFINFTQVRSFYFWGNWDPRKLIIRGKQWERWSLNLDLIINNLMIC